MLTEPKNALVKQYQALFAMENAELNFTEGGLQAIAHKAHEKDIGARGLRSIIEEVMLDIMYELPDQPPASQLPGHRGRGFRPPAVVRRREEECVKERMRAEGGRGKANNFILPP